jgi:glucosamine--fructose-6-phosphate aminotransferase (isomerizing)
MEKGQLTYPEISGQPEALAAAWSQAGKQKDWIDAYIGSDRFDDVVFIGSGSSYYQAQVMAKTFRSWTGRTAQALPSSELMLFRSQHTGSGQKLVVGVSRSGESTEVLLALESVKDLPDWTRCGITCYETSAMAVMVPCLVSPLGKEKSTVMTKSFSSMTYMMQAAIALAANDKVRLGELEAVLAQDEAIVNKADELAQSIVKKHGAFKKYVYLAMGSLFGLAEEACLKIKEMSYVWVESFGTMEFRHGPKSIVEPGTLVCVLVSEQARSYELKVAQEMQAYGATVLLLTAQAGDDTAFADYVFELGFKEASDEARAVLYLPLLQYFGYYTALDLDRDPDHPRNLTQVVVI